MVLDKEIPPDPRVEREANFLANAGYNVFVFSLDFSGLAKEELYKNFIIYRRAISKQFVKKISALVNTFPVYHWILGKWVTEFIARYEIDILHMHDLYTIPIGQYAKQKVGIPLIADLHENYPAAIKAYEWANSLLGKLFARPNRWKKLEGQYLQSAEKLIVLSEAYKNQLTTKYGFLKDEDVYIYPNVPNTKKLQAFPDYEVLTEFQGRFILLYFGIISKRRGIHTCLQALRQLKNTIPNILLLLIGPIDKKEQKTFYSIMKEEALREYLKYIPWKDMEYIPSYIRRCDIGLSPLVKNDQHNSGIANKVFQYLAFGKPIIVSDCIPQKQLVEEESCGIIFQSENVQEFVDAVENIYRNPKESGQMGKNGKNAVENKYNVSQYGKVLVDLYESL